MTHAASMTVLLTLTLLTLAARQSAALFLPNSPELRQLLSRYQQEANWNGTANTDPDAQPHARQRRAIPWSDREEILKLHNKLRGGVYPTASNMEYMVSVTEGPSFNKYFGNQVPILVFVFTLLVQALDYGLPNWNVNRSGDVVYYALCRGRGQCWCDEHISQTHSLDWTGMHCRQASMERALIS